MSIHQGILFFWKCGISQRSLEQAVFRGKIWREQLSIVVNNFLLRYIYLMQQQNGVLRVLGIDPGLASTGWGIVDFYQNRFKIVAYGVIETSADATRGERLSAIYSRITNILMEYHPAEAGMETLYFAKGVEGISSAVWNLSRSKYAILTSMYGS